MGRFFVLFCYLLTAIVVRSQTLMPADEMRLNPCLSASNGLAYPGPKQQKLTPPPAGKRPFYLSHYGRHGSRYMINPVDYNYLLNALVRAEREQKLTALGQELLRRVRIVAAEASDRLGELTPIGASQQRDIGRRMVERFPQIFKKNAFVDARSTTVVRCVLSMENVLQQMIRMNPKLDVSQDASYRDMNYMNQQDRQITERSRTVEGRQTYDDFCRRHECWQRPVYALFKDTAYANHVAGGERFCYYLFRMAGNLQNTRAAETLSLYDFFTPEEILDNWRKENASWFLSFGYTPLNGGQQPFIQRNLLQRIIEQADSCLLLDRPSAHLRFGHETVVLPLVCLMGLNGMDKSIGCLDSLEQEGWVNYRVFPMACNVQLVFYRKNAADKDVLVKVLLNENEATLPLSTSQAPYYRWTDVRRYWQGKLASYKNE